MVHVSKKYIKQDSLERMASLFQNIISNSFSQSEFGQLIDDIMTPTEKIMMVKRIFILYLIHKQVPQDDISKAVKVSSGTVSRYAVAYIHCSPIIKDLFSKIETKEKIINIIDDLFSELFYQPGLYKNHWQFYQEYLKRKAQRDTSGLDLPIR